MVWFFLFFKKKTLWPLFMGRNFVKATKPLQEDSLLFTNFFIIQFPVVAGTQLTGIFYVDATMKRLFLSLLSATYPNI